MQKRSRVGGRTRLVWATILGIAIWTGCAASPETTELEELGIQNVGVRIPERAWDDAVAELCKGEPLREVAPQFRSDYLPDLSDGDAIDALRSAASMRCPDQTLR